LRVEVAVHPVEHFLMGLEPPWSRRGATASDTCRIYMYLVEHFFV
jgi:hypothetical protein